jgi:hypothetical protein
VSIALRSNRLAIRRQLTVNCYASEYTEVDNAYMYDAICTSGIEEV